MAFTTVEKGSQYTKNYRIYFKNGDVPISPMHDIPLFADKAKKIYNMVVEIPRWTNAKMEICLCEKLNPIKQDIKNGQVRFVKNCFPHKGYIWNYGALPQTWENPLVVDEHTSQGGDKDPIDAIDIGYRVAKRGEVIQVKVLGIIALIDEGETDWKVITIDVRDPLAELLNDLQDIEIHCAGLLKATVEWLQIYKIPDGKPENKFAFNKEPQPAQFAHKIIEDVHAQWQKLVGGEVQVEGICRDNTTQKKFQITSQEGEGVIGANDPLAPSAPLEPTVDKWYFVCTKGKK